MTQLAQAFRFHLQAAQARAVLTDGRNTFFAKMQRDLDALAGGKAARAMGEARRDVAAGCTRYPAPVKPYPASAKQDDGCTYVEHPESSGLRFVGRVQVDCGSRDGYWDKRGDSGWFTDPYGDTSRDGAGLCYGVVYQLPGRKGESRFVAGYQFGGCDGGPTLDLGRVYAESACDWNCHPNNMESAHEAARAADSMAQRAAEQEREYQTAWAAGNRWSDMWQEVQDAAAELRAVLAERRAVKGTAGYPALCRAIRSHVTGLMSQIRKARATMAKLAEGEVEPLYFYPGEARLRDAFNEAAGNEVLK